MNRGMIIASCLAAAWCGAGCDNAESDDTGARAEDTAALCSDGLDNDHDGAIDCDDGDCQVFVFCAGATDADADGDGDGDADIDTDPACVLRVDAESGAGDADGSTWETAFASVQLGIDHACLALEEDTGLDECQVWVAEGTYNVYQTHVDDTILLRPGVVLLGGFDGSETSVTERDFVANETVLDGRDSDVGLYHVLHVVTGADGSRIDGFTVSGGFTDAYYELVMDGWGGGMLLDGVSMTIANCRFEDNHASLGGGIACEDCNASIVRSVFEGNSAGYQGGGLLIWRGDVVVQGCVFLDNYAEDSGGGIDISIGESDSVSLDSCALHGNWTDGLGGGIYSEISGQLDMANLVLAGNAAPEGGGICNHAGHLSHSILTGSSLVDNDGGGLLQQDYGGAIEVRSSVFWDNAPFQLDFWQHASSLEVAYSDVQGGYEGEGNIDADPLFSNAEGVDFGLEPGSPCIDAADGEASPEFDLEGHPRVDHPDSPNTGIGPPWADMGAYEHQPD